MSEKPLNEYIDLEAYDVVTGEQYRALKEQLEVMRNGSEQALLLLERDRFEDDSEAKVVRAVLKVALGSNPASESLVTGENLAARVQQARHLLDSGNEVEIIAWMLGRSVEDVRRVVSDPASQPTASTDAVSPAPGHQRSDLPESAADSLPASSPSKAAGGWCERHGGYLGQRCATCALEVVDSAPASRQDG